MIVLDTSIWIEYFKQNPDYAPKIKKLLENREILAVECIFGELLQGAKSRRENELLTSYWESLPKCKRKNLWIDAGRYSAENKLHAKGIGLIDCAIIISARNHKAKIWSLDKKLTAVLKEDEIFTTSVYNQLFKID